jgi:hypothetical protein
VDLITKGHFRPKSNRQDYDEAVIKLFTEIGYTPRAPDDLGTALVQPNELAITHTKESESAEAPVQHINQQSLGAVFDWRANQERLTNSEVVHHVFEGVPKRIAQKEKAHLIMAGYTSDGQVDFVVCAVNERELHIRARQHFLYLLRYPLKDALF